MSTKHIPFLVLVVTAFSLSRGMFALFNDPEGPNLLIVTVLAAIILGMSLAFNYFYSSTMAITSYTRLAVALFVQIVTVSVVYLLLK